MGRDPVKPERILVDLGLRPYAAKALVALAARDDGNTVELAEVSGVPRTSIYGAMEEAVRLRLAVQLPTTGVARWRTSWPMVVAGLAAMIEDRAQAETAKLSSLRATVAGAPVR